MKTVRALVLLVVVLVALPYNEAIADRPSREQVVATVKSAIAFYKSSGRTKTLAELNNKDGQFAKGENYVDVHDLQGVCVAHPTAPEVVGVNRLEQKDLNGKFWIKDIIAATQKGDTSGWSRYVRKNPVTGRMQDKLSYWELYDGLIFKAGLYID
jgi:signal transduction histidine kinase